jgi:hypothetical protein
MIPMLAVLFAQAGGNAQSATVPLLLLCLFAGFLAVRMKGAQVPHLFLGACIGVLGANGIVGTLVWAVLNIVPTILSKLGEAIAS